MEKPFRCPICGGQTIIKIDSGLAVCEACAQWTEADPAQLRRLRDTVARAERLTRLNTAAGCKQAVRLLEEISGVADVEGRIADCRAALEAVRETRGRQKKTAQEDDKRDTATGIVLIVLIVLVCLVVLGGAIAAFVLWSKGKLPPSAAFACVCVMVAVGLIVVLSKK